MQSLLSRMLAYNCEHGHGSGHLVLHGPLGPTTFHPVHLLHLLHLLSGLPCTSTGVMLPYCLMEDDLEIGEAAATSVTQAAHPAAPTPRVRPIGTSAGKTAVLASSQWSLRPLAALPSVSVTFKMSVWISQHSHSVQSSGNSLETR